MRQEQYFSANYRQSREKFLELAHKTGATVRSVELPDPREKNRWFVDTARLGPDSPESVLVIVSGTHGVEGFAGAACQCALLDSWSADSKAALLLVHALNPWGFDKLRRCNEHNVDLNRNFVEFSVGTPVNPGYAELEPLLLPPSWNGARRVAADLRLYSQLLTGKRRKLQGAITAGQYESPRGIFFGGHEAAWSRRVWEDILAHYRQWPLTVLDIHTGLGRYGDAQLLTNLDARSADYATLQGIFGASLNSSANEASISAKTNGALIDTLPDGSRSVVLEFGTYSAAKVLNGLRREAIDWRNSVANNDLKDIFCPDDPKWRDKILDQFFQIITACNFIP